MPRQTRGSVYATKNGYGIRWQHEGERCQKAGFRTRTDARDWFRNEKLPQLLRGGPSAEVTLKEFIDIYLDRWAPTISRRTSTTLREWIGCPLDRNGKPRTLDGSAIHIFGSFTLAELEGAADDIARWRARLPSEDRRYKATKALRQVLTAAVRWKYMARNPAVDAGANPQPRREEVQPFTRAEIDMLVEELKPKHAALVVFAAETGLRTNEWMASERKDVDRKNPAVAVARRVSRGKATPYPKTKLRRVPLTPRAEEALSWLPARIDTPLLFPAAMGGFIDLDNWRLRVWYPALEGAGIAKRGPYELRHTFASEALAAGVSIFELSRLMGASVETIETHYGHLVRDSENHLRSLLTARSAVEMPSAESDGDA